MNKFFDIPTDNLYKFISISGLVLLISITSLFIFYMSSLDKKYYDYNSNNELIEKDSVILNKLFLSINRDTTNYLTEIEKQIRIADFELKYNEKQNENNIRMREYQFYYNNKFYIVLSFIILVSFSLFIIVYGFYLWYKKLQNYLDIKVRDDATKEKHIKLKETFDNLNFIYYYIIPIRNSPDDDWSDALDSVSSKFYEIEEKLMDFLKKHTSSLNEDEVQRIKNLINIASSNKFTEEQYDGRRDKDTENFLKLFEKLIKDMYNKLNQF